MVVSFCTAIAYTNANTYNIRIAIGVALRCCNLSLVAVRSNFRSVSAKNEGNSHLDGMRAKEKTNTSPYGIHLFCVLFYALSLSCFHLHGVASIRLHYIVHGRHLIYTSICNLCSRMFFSLSFFLFRLMCFTASYSMLLF